MSDNGTKRKYLEKYSDEEMVYEALLLYANHRHAFASAIAQKEYRNSAGEEATMDEISFATHAAEQADRLVAYAKEKAESPIIQLQ